MKVTWCRSMLSASSSAMLGRVTTHSCSWGMVRQHLIQVLYRPIITAAHAEVQVPEQPRTAQTLKACLVGCVQPVNRSGHVCTSCMCLGCTPIMVSVSGCHNVTLTYWTEHSRPYRVWKVVAVHKHRTSHAAKHGNAASVSNVWNTLSLSGHSGRMLPELRHVGE